MYSYYMTYYDREKHSQVMIKKSTKDRLDHYRNTFGLKSYNKAICQLLSRWEYEPSLRPHHRLLDTLS
jgi:hypothetical protein